MLEVYGSLYFRCNQSRLKIYPLLRELDSEKFNRVCTGKRYSKKLINMIHINILPFLRGIVTFFSTYGGSVTHICVINLARHRNSFQCCPMSVLAPQISDTSTVCPTAQQLANLKETTRATHHWPDVIGIHRWPKDFLHKGPVIQKTFPCNYAYMCKWYGVCLALSYNNVSEGIVTFIPNFYSQVKYLRPAVLRNVIHMLYDMNHNCGNFMTTSLWYLSIIKTSSLDVIMF